MAVAKPGAIAAVGWAGVNFLGNIEGRLFLDRFYGMLPHPLLQRAAHYVVKIINIGILGGLAGMIRASGSTRAALRTGGVVNVGVSLINDLAGAFAPLQPLAANLKDYVLYGQPYATAMGGGLRDYRTLTGQMSDAMVPVGQDPYGAMSGIYSD